MKDRRKDGRTLRTEGRKDLFAPLGTLLATRAGPLRVDEVRKSDPEVRIGGEIVSYIGSSIEVFFF